MTFIDVRPWRSAMISASSRSFSIFTGVYPADRSAIRFAVTASSWFFSVEVVLGDLEAIGPRRQVEPDHPVEATRTQQGRVEVGGAVGGGHDQDVRFGARRARTAPVGGQEPVEPVDPPGLELLATGRQVEALHLHEQFVDDADDAFAHRAGVHAAAGAADGVELLDVADRAALFAGGLAQRLEERTDLLVRLAVVHRLELAGRHEQERHAGLGGHRLREVRLAGAGGALEQHAAAGVAAHLALEGLRREEQVHRVDRLTLGLVGADDVVETDVGVRRLAAACAANGRR